MSEPTPTPDKIDHATFREQIAAALAGGLTPAEQSAFDAHAAGCAECAGELNAAKAAEDRMTALFASSAPMAGFEDRIIQSLRVRRGTTFQWRPNWRIHPAVTKAVSGVAAAIVLAGFGYVATQMLDDGSTNRVRTASDLRQIGQAMSLHANDNNGGYPRGKSNDSFGVDFSTAPTFNLQAGDGLVVSGNNTFRGGTGAGDRSSHETTNHGAITLNGGSAVNNESLVRQQQKQEKQGQTEASNRFYFNYGDGNGQKPANAPVSGTSEPHVDDWFKPMQLAKAGESDKGVSLGGKLVTGLEVRADVERVAQLSDSNVDAKKLPAVAQATPGAPAAPAEVPPAPAMAPPPASPAPAPAPEQPPMPQHEANSRKVIRNGQLEFEVERFDSAFAQVSKLTTEAGGYVGTTDSEKLPNGKVRGTVTVRVPPDRLDTLVLQLRGIGDLKSQKMEAQDVSKHYSDMDSELRAAKAMEERLLAIIKEGKGQIKDLLAAEKELGNWRTKIEQLVGEMKFLDNQVALSTLNITLFEKDIKTPATAYENETIDSGVETENVEKARADALKAIEDAKGRVIQSDLKRYDAGQFAATIIADVPADTAGPMLDRLKQLGKMARLDVQGKQTVAENAATGAGGAPVRVEKRDTRLNLSLYNLANVAPRQSTTLSLAADDVESTYRAILARVTKANGRVITSNLARNKPEATTGTISFEVPSAEADAVKADVQSNVETMKMAVNDNPDVQNSTSAKRGFTVTLASTASIAPRETAALQLAAVDVVAAREKILAAAGSSGNASRVLATQLNAGDAQNVTATIDLDVRRGDALAKVEKAIADAGQTVSRTVSRSTDTENTLDSKVHLSLSIGLAEKLPPREMTRMSVELSDVESAMGDLTAMAQSIGGKTVESNLSKSRDGQSTAHVVVDVPLDKAGEIVKHARELGAVRAIDSGKNLQVPTGPLAKARVDVTFGNAEAIVSPDKGFWASVRRGLSTSVAALLWSLQLVVTGLCLLLPIALIYLGWRVIRARRRNSVVAP